MERMYTGYLMLDWSTGKVKLSRRKPRKSGPYMIPVKFEIQVQMPEEQQEIVGKGKIVLSQSQATQIIFSDA